MSEEILIQIGINLVMFTAFVATMNQKIKDLCRRMDKHNHLVEKTYKAELIAQNNADRLHKLEKDLQRRDYNERL